jgi:hypothetical protein
LLLVVYWEIKLYLSQYIGIQGTRQGGSSDQTLASPLRPLE